MSKLTFGPLIDLMVISECNIHDISHLPSQEREIIGIVDAAPARKKKKTIAFELGLPASTVSTIIKNCDSLQVNHALTSSIKKRSRDPSHPTRLDVDKDLYQLFCAARA